MTYVGPPIIFGQPWFDEAEENLALQTIRSGWIGQGPLVQRFENGLAEYVGSKHQVAVSSCTAALHLALVAAGIGPGDEVITTPFTFVATVNAIEHSGATPVLVDIDRDTLNIMPAAVEAAVTGRTRAILPVHFGGRPVDTAGFYDLADRKDLWIVEDAAHALGAVSEGRRIGGSRNSRVMTCFSFYPNKNLATAEGGAIAVHDDALVERLASLRLHGLSGDAWARYKEPTYQPSLVNYAGFKYNFTDLQASIALGQLDKLEGFLAGREYLADQYDKALAGIPGIRTVPRGEFTTEFRHALHLYQIVVEAGHAERDRLIGALRANNIGAAVHYIGVNQHPYYQSKFSDSFPNSDWATDSLLTLPLHLHMSLNDVERVAAAVRSVMATATT